MNRKEFLKSAGIIGTAATIGVLGGCNRHPEKIEGKISASSADLLSAVSKLAPFASVITADSNYKTVDFNWLQNTFYASFKKELFDKGVTQWDAHFDCDKFAQYFTSLLQVAYYVANFYSWNTSESLAVGQLYYLIGGKQNQGHAINIIYKDDGGFLFFEPQSGQFVALSDAELKSIFFVKF